MYLRHISDFSLQSDFRLLLKISLQRMHLSGMQSRHLVNNNEMVTMKGHRGHIEHVCCNMASDAQYPGAGRDSLIHVSRSTFHVSRAQTLKHVPPVCVATLRLRQLH